MEKTPVRSKTILYDRLVDQISGCEYKNDTS